MYEILRETKNIMIYLQIQIKQQENKVSSSKVDARQKAKLEKVLKEAEEKLEKAKHNAGEVRYYNFLNLFKIFKYLFRKRIKKFT